MFVFAALFVASSLCVSASALEVKNPIDLAAVETVVSQSVEVLPNGLTAVTTISERIQSNYAYAAKASYTKTGSKTTTLKNGNTVLFTFTVNGTFSYTPGVSATCTASSYSYSIGSGSDWKFDYGSANRSGNTAIADGHFYRKILFITVDTYNAHETLTCDSNGNLS